MSDRAATLIADIMTAAANCSLYSREHGAVQQFSERAVAAMEDLFEDDALSVTVLGDRMLVNETPMSGKSLHMDGFIKKLRRKGLERLEFRRGITPAELAGLIAQLTAPEAKPASSRNISVGAIEVKLKSDAPGDVAQAMQKNVARIKEVYHGLSKFGTLNTVGLEEVVINFIATLKEESNILRVVSPVKSYSEYTFAHTTNVSVLSIFQAESMGIKGEILHDVGMSGLLHDIGKMFVSKDILEKDSKLDPHEWEAMKKHPLYGAMYLAKQPDMPRLAIVVAYEHHMRFDGKGYPSARRRGQTQHFISQIVAISDFFDALRTERPYRRALGVPEIMGLLHESSGKNFSPELVDSFIGKLRSLDIA